MVVLWIMAVFPPLFFGPWVLLPQSTGGRLVVLTGTLLLCAAFWLGLRTGTLRVVADDQGVRGTRFLGGSVHFAWGEVTAVRERSRFDPIGKRMGEDVELLAGTRSVTITDAMTGFAELRALIDRQAAGVPRTRHRIGPHASPTPRSRKPPGTPAAELDDASSEAAAEVPSTDAGVVEDDGGDTQRGLWLALVLLLLSGIVAIAFGIGEPWLRAA